MRLALNTREIGDVIVVQCTGRVVAGAEMESLRSQILGLMPEHKDFVLHLGDVALIDSSGLGMMVRLLTGLRRSQGDLKLCNVPQAIDNLLRMTNLDRVFEIHQSEESAISAFYKRRSAPESTSTSGPPVLCVDHNCDVLAYVREFLKKRGYDVQTTGNLHDALILLRVTRPALLLLGPNLNASPATQKEFEQACMRAPVVELGNDFCTLDAGQAASRLMDRIQDRLQSGATMPS
ncbi:MAG TPA: anti-sigma factor antagonist [Terriglobales bacterium]|nr:anti-sigma factor antagonist [Terriglobales bacterium]